MERQIILQATIEALKHINQQRFFDTERGYHGKFYCELQSALDARNMLYDGIILEMEYQKSERHSTHQRPDIVLHIPRKYPGGTVKDNNFAVWALKHRASDTRAADDFKKLDEMFEELCYPLGVFINIGDSRHHYAHYNGRYANRLVCFAVALDADGRPQVTSSEDSSADAV